jgi:hypothetical protein
MTKPSIQEYRLALALAVQDQPRLYYFQPLAWSRIPEGRVLRKGVQQNQQELDQLARARIKQLLQACRIEIVPHSVQLVRSYVVDNRTIMLWWVETPTVKGVPEQLIVETWLPRRDERCATLIGVMERILSDSLDDREVRYRG